MAGELAGVTLETLLRALHQVELQALALQAEHRIGSGRTADVVEQVALKADYLADMVRDEIAVLRRYSEAQS